MHEKKKENKTQPKKKRENVQENKPYNYSVTSIYSAK